MSQANQTVGRICFKTPKEDFLDHFFRHFYIFDSSEEKKSKKRMRFPFESELKRKLILLGVWTKLS